MNPEALKALLARVQQGAMSIDDALRELRALPFGDLGFATIDHHRSVRQGFAEVVFGPGKTPSELVAIASELVDHDQNVLVTRVSPEGAQALARAFPDAVVHEVARAVTIERNPTPQLPGPICIVTAGTSDGPVAEEASVTARFLGNEVVRVTDVGVAGIHRTLAHRATFEQAAVLIVVAGMEGALASVIGGLVGRPTIAVPTSVGYGAAFDGLAALLGMMTCCAAGVTVVNIDNGFGAAYAAALITRGRT